MRVLDTLSSWYKGWGTLHRQAAYRQRSNLPWHPRMEVLAFHIVAGACQSRLDRVQYAHYKLLVYEVCPYEQLR